MSKKTSVLLMLTVPLFTVGIQALLRSPPQSVVTGSSEAPHTSAYASGGMPRLGESRFHRPPGGERFAYGAASLSVVRAPCPLKTVLSLHTPLLRVHSICMRFPKMRVLVATLRFIQPIAAGHRDSAHPKRPHRTSRSFGRLALRATRGIREAGFSP